MDAIKILHRAWFNNVESGDILVHTKTGELWVCLKRGYEMQHSGHDGLGLHLIFYLAPLGTKGDEDWPELLETDDVSMFYHTNMDRLEHPDVMLAKIRDDRLAKIRDGTGIKSRRRTGRKRKGRKRKSRKRKSRKYRKKYIIN